MVVAIASLSKGLRFFAVAPLLALISAARVSIPAHHFATRCNFSVLDLNLAIPIEKCP